MKEEAATRQAEVHTRDQHDAGTPSREEAGKFKFKLDLLVKSRTQSKLTFLKRCRIKKF
jgi:hypothetical protein